MKEFAEGATALAAASLRMQMMILEQTRDMLDDVAGMAASIAALGNAED